MKDTQKLAEDFENLLCSQNDAIDNASFHLAVAIVRQNAEETKQNAVELAEELVFGDKKPDKDNSVIEKIIDDAKYVLISQKLFHEGMAPSEADNLEWNMEFIGEINDAAEADLLEAGFETCHPYYGEEEKMCFECDDCPNATCRFKQENS